MGENRITTHADEGGSGYGYVTIFEKLKKYNASLYITEHEPDTYRYAKRIDIRFDGMLNYNITSYRSMLIDEHKKYYSPVLLNTYR